MDSTKHNSKEIELDLLNGEQSKKLKPEETERVMWANKCEYIIALMGYTVGLGSIWRFPYLCMKNGGGAFLIPFIIFMAMCGFPLYILELAIGQFSGKSPLVIWSMCPLLKGVGSSMVILSFVLTWYYGLPFAWICYYLVYSFYPTQPWSSCDNDWNTAQCIVTQSIKKDGNNNFTTVYNRTFQPKNFNNSTIQHRPTAASEFWRNKVLNISTGMFDFGHIQWQMVLFLFLAIALNFLCIAKGVRSVGKVAYVTALTPYVLLIVILIRSLTLEGSVDGVLYFIKPDFSRLRDYHVWLEAALQVFYSLGPGWGGVITMASYNKFSNKFVRDAVIITTTDCFSALLCGLVVFSIVGFLAKETGLSIPEAAESGPGLVFVAYPEALARLPVPHLWSVIFFIMLLFVGVDSQFGMLETVISGLVDLYPKTLGKRKVLLLVSMFLFYFITSVMFASRAGIYIFVFIDWYTSAFTVFLVTALECIIVGWIYGAERFSRDVNLMIGRPIPRVMRISMFIVTPCALFVAFILTLTDYSHPTYKGYIYPDFTRPIGILIGLASTLPIPCLLLWQLLRSSGSFKKRFLHLLRPSDWQPHDSAVRKYYNKYRYSTTFLQKIKINLLGE